MVRRRHRATMGGLAPLVAIVVLLAACSTNPEEVVGGDSTDQPSGDGEVVEIVWSHFWVGTNPLTPWGEVLIEEFNEQYAGQYRVVERQVPGDPEHQEQLRADAAADALPDVTTGNISVMRELTATGLTADLTSYLEEDDEWRESFIEGAFEYYTEDDGSIYAIPYSADYIGIFYNQDLFAQAGVEEFPETWDDFLAASEQLDAAGILPFAVDGDWVTLLMWANMIGTQPGGADWLSDQSPEREFASVDAVVAGTEMLRDYHQAGYVNEDAFTGDYGTAATLYLQGQAAMIANGPWMINQITGEVAESAEGVGEATDYTTSPGDGSIFIIGEAGFAVGAKDPEKIEAAVEFIKFVTSEEQQINQLKFVGRSGPIDMEVSDEDAAEIDPLALSIIEQGEQVSSTYPHAYHAIAPDIMAEWRNQWPAYAQGDLTTEEFLGLLDAVAP